jgi:hypothetical protein
LIQRARSVVQSLRNKAALQSQKSLKISKNARSGKEVQRGLVLTDFQYDTLLRDSARLYDGIIKFYSDMKEEDIRVEITHLWYSMFLPVTLEDVMKCKISEIRFSF